MASGAAAPLLRTRSLREQVYDHLRQEMARGGLRIGGFLDLDRLAAQLGISRTPLREALLQLSHEGFVTILPRRGFRLEPLTADDIRHFYEIIGALEASVLRAVGHRLGPAGLARMRQLNEGMARAVAEDDFDRYYELNLAFHEAYLGLSDNQRLRATVGSLKQRLYDWPRRRGFVKAWEEHSVSHEHARLLELLEAGDVAGAAAHLQDVHWSFEIQKDFIHAYYFSP
jgi:DNA-binding GntR family transcriptional regulator